MAKVSSLWVGSSLSVAHNIALASFVYYGHQVKLYLYDMNIEVPHGVVKADANKIIPESKIFKHFNSYAAFSDIFRYAMIIKTGEMWVDTDTFCFSSTFFDNNEYVFIEEASGIYAGGILKLPQKSDIALSLYENAKKIILKKKDYVAKSPDDLPWDDWVIIGPGLITKWVNIYSLDKFAINHNAINLLNIHHESPVDMFWDPNFKDEALLRSRSAVSGTFFNSWLDQRNWNKNELTAGSAIEYFYNKFILKM